MNGWRHLIPATVAVLMAMVAGAPTALAAAPGFAVAPLRIDIDTPPGSKRTQTITVRNTATAPVQFTLSVEDVEGSVVDPDATPLLLGGRVESPISGYDWITGYPSTLTVGAQSSRSFTVTAAPPTGVRGGRYAALVVSSPARGSGAISAKSRVAVVFLMNAGGAPPPKIAIERVKRYKDGGVKVIYQNDPKSETAVTPSGDQVTDRPIWQGGGEGARRKLQCTTALPGGLGSCTSAGRGGGSGSGSGSGSAGADAGSGGGSGDAADGSDAFGTDGGRIDLVTEDGERVSSDVPRRWAGSWTSMLFPLVGISLFAGYFAFLRRRDDDEDEAEPAHFGA